VSFPAGLLNNVQFSGYDGRSVEASPSYSNMPPRLSMDDDVKPSTVPQVSMSSIRRSRFLEEATMSMAGPSEPTDLRQTWKGGEDTQTFPGGRPTLTKCCSENKHNRSPKPRITRARTLDGSHQQGGGGGFTTTTFSRLGVAFTEKGIASQPDVDITELLGDEKEEDEARMGDQAKDARSSTPHDGACGLAEVLRQAEEKSLHLSCEQFRAMTRGAENRNTSQAGGSVRLEAETLTNLCRICMNDDCVINTVSLPCCHRVACLQCAQKLYFCSICRARVESFLKTFDG